MQISEKQRHEVLSPKKCRQRGLEEYITQQERGDKTIYDGKKHQYAFINNPVYRVFGDNDPAPFGLSSRHFAKPLAPSESPLHLLNETVDSGGVFIPAKHWNNRWAATRVNIPNISATPAQVVKDKEKMLEYDYQIAKNLRSIDMRQRKQRIGSSFQIPTEEFHLQRAGNTFYPPVLKEGASVGGENPQFTPPSGDFNILPMPQPSPPRPRLISSQRPPVENQPNNDILPEEQPAEEVPNVEVKPEDPVDEKHYYTHDELYSSLREDQLLDKLLTKVQDKVGTTEYYTKGVEDTLNAMNPNNGIKADDVTASRMWFVTIIMVLIVIFAAILMYM
jgi:hypothetical protein